MPETVSFDLCAGLAGDPMLSSIGSGEFKLNGTLPDDIIEELHNQYKYLNETCVAYNKDYNKNAILHSEYTMTNSTVNTTYMKESDITDGQVMMVNLRSTESSDAYSNFPCSGYQKYVCVGESFGLTGAKLKLEICGTEGSYDNLYTSSEEDFETDTWYTISFTAVGDLLTCSMTDTYTGDVKITASYDVSDTSEKVDSAGSAEIGVYSNSIFFKSFIHKDLSWTEGDM